MTNIMWPFSVYSDMSEKMAQGEAHFRPDVVFNRICDAVGC